MSKLMQTCSYDGNAQQQACCSPLKHTLLACSCLNTTAEGLQKVIAPEQLQLHAVDRIPWL